MSEKTIEELLAIRETAISWWGHPVMGDVQATIDAVDAELERRSQQEA